MIELAVLAAIGILLVGALVAATSILGGVLDVVFWILFLPFRLLAFLILIPLFILKVVVGLVLTILAVPLLAVVAVALAVVAVLVPLLPLLLLGLLLWAAFKVLQAMIGFAAV